MTKEEETNLENTLTNSQKDDLNSSLLMYLLSQINF